VLDNHTVQILAMSGGFDFERSKFNRAVQAMRQIGSTFKAFVYTAAIDRGYTPASALIDKPVSFEAGPGQPPYEPLNYDRTFEGAMTLRRALEISRNVPAVSMMHALGPANVIEYARRFGLRGPMEPYLSLALGAAEATLVEITSAFSVFPNQGVRMRPYLVLKVTDRLGDVLEDNRPESTETVRADTAYVMTSLLRGVARRGTAASAAALKWPLGGKTGTTDDYGDAWMIGFDPDISVGVWVGFDQKQPLGHNQSGAVAALPIWIDFWRSYIEGRETPAEFPAPANIVTVTVDRRTGEVAMPGSGDTIDEVFIAGTQPGLAFPRATGGPGEP
jgi:penicillin-binding protein 1A